jgi:hypothetical protein
MASTGRHLGMTFFEEGGRDRGSGAVESFNVQRGVETRISIWIRLPAYRVLRSGGGRTAKRPFWRAAFVDEMSTASAELQPHLERAS